MYYVYIYILVKIYQTIFEMYILLKIKSQHFC